MTPKDFVAAYAVYARETYAKTGILPEIILAQAALESGYGKHAPGNMFFGVKDFDGINGNEQLVTTFEYSKRGDLTAAQIGLASVTRVEPTTLAGQKYFKYTGKAYFRKYETPEACFTDHARVFMTARKNGALRYEKALAVKDNPDRFFEEIQKAGYAQSPIYAKTLSSICKTIKTYLV